MNGSMNLSSVKTSIYNHRQTTFSSAVPRHTSLRVFTVQTDPKPPASYAVTTPTAVTKTVGLNVDKSKWAPESWTTKKALQQPDLCRTWVEEERMKLLTYNVNGLRQRVSQFDSLLKLLDSFDADIICFY